MLASGAFSIDGTGASNVTATSGNLSVRTTTSGDLNLMSADMTYMSAGANMDIDVTGSYDMQSSGVFSIDGVGASNVTATSGNLSLTTLTSGDVIANSIGALDLDAATTVDILAGTTFSIDGTGASNVTATSGTLLLSTLTSGNVNLTSAGSIFATSAGAFDVNASGAATIDSVGDSYFKTNGGSFRLANEAGGGVVYIESGDPGSLASSIADGNDIELNSTDDVIVIGVGDFKVDMAAAVDIDAGTTLNIDAKGAHE